MNSSQNADAVGLRVIWVFAAAAIVFAVAVYCSVLGVNFGNHPDEWRVLKSVENSFRTGIFLQRWYDWGSLGYDIGAITAIVSYLKNDAVRNFVEHGLNVDVQTPIGFFRQHGHLNLLLRSILAVISLSVVFPVAHLVWRLTRQLWPSVLSAIIVGLSFQLNYHARWYAGDAPLMVFSFLAVYFSALFYWSRGWPSYVWLTGAAIAVGFAASAKYTGGMFLIAPALAVVLKTWTKPSIRWTTVQLWLPTLVGQWAICVFVSGLTFTLLNPAVLVEPFVFFADLQHVQHLYATGANTNQDTTSRPENVLLSLLFVFLAGPSEYIVLSLCTVVLFLAGFRRSSRRVDLLILVLPFALFFFLLAWQKVMVARNLLPMLPFMAAMCGLGAANLSESWPKLRLALPALCLVFFVANGSYLWQSTREIGRMTTETELAAMRSYIESRPEATFSIDQTVSTKDPQILSLPNARPLDQASPGDFIATEAAPFLNSMAIERRHCSTNRPGLFVVFGPHDSSFDYYTGMIGAGRFIIMERNTYQQVLDRTPSESLICWPLMRVRWVY